MFTSLNEMAEREELGRFLVGLAGEGIAKCRSKHYKSVSRFINCHKCTRAIISQAVGSFHWEPTKFRDWIKAIENYALLAGEMTTNQKVFLTRPVGVLLVITFIGIWPRTQKIVGNN